MSKNIEVVRQKEPGDYIISAFDNMTWEQAISQAQEIGPNIGYAKTNSLHQRLGVDYAVKTFAKIGLDLMLDAKYHDIPETVKNHVFEATAAGSSLITVHISGGEKMLEAAVEGRELGRETVEVDDEKRKQIGKLLGITVLTSLDKQDCKKIFGISRYRKKGIEKKVIRFAKIALHTGLDGIVCSALELEAIRKKSEFDNLLTVVPGITPSFAQKANDQKRTSSIRDAIRRGADYIVIGRGINSANNYGLSKKEASELIVEEIKNAL